VEENQNEQEVSKTKIFGLEEIRK